MVRGSAWKTGPTAVMGVMWGAAAQAVRPGSWPRTTRDVLARQVYFTGVQAVPLACGIAVLVGLTVVSQTQIWLQRLGGTALLGPLLVGIVVTNLAPFLVNFVVIGRSGTAITTELASMEINGETRVLDTLGVDPFIYLVIPRVTGVLLSVFGLTAIFTVVSLASGYALSLLIADTATDLVSFVHSIAAAMAPLDFVSLAGKCLLPALATGSICCLEGLSVGTALTEIPQATTRAVVRSVVVLFVLTAVFAATVGR
jgi:phospholipid/cholesterol/gamma-HCH transport system permease protein